MKKNANTTEPTEQREKRARSHNDRLSYLERYMKEAKHSASIDSFGLHVNAEGWAEVVTIGGTAFPDRETMIQSWMMIPVEIIVGTWPTQERFRYTPSREEAEQKIELLHGERPTRIICAANPHWDWRNDQQQQRAA